MAILRTLRYALSPRPKRSLEEIRVGLLASYLEDLAEAEPEVRAELERLSLRDEEICFVLKLAEESARLRAGLPTPSAAERDRFLQQVRSEREAAQATGARRLKLRAPSLVRKIAALITGTGLLLAATAGASAALEKYAGIDVAPVEIPLLQSSDGDEAASPTENNVAIPSSEEQSTSGTGTQALGELTSTEPASPSNEPEEPVVIVEEPAGFDQDDRPAAVLPSAPAAPDATPGSDGSGEGTAIESEPPGEEEPADDGVTVQSSSCGNPDAPGLSHAPGLDGKDPPCAGEEGPNAQGAKAQDANAEAKSANGKGPRSQRS